MFPSKTEKHVTIMGALWNAHGDIKDGNFFEYEKTRVSPIATQLLPVSGVCFVCGCSLQWRCALTGVCASIKEPVTKDILLQLIETERWMPPHPHPPLQECRGEDGTRGLMPPPKKIPRSQPPS